MLVLIVNVLALLLVFKANGDEGCYPRKCHSSAINFYHTLNCTVLSTDENGCETSFDCKDVVSREKCRFNGKLFEPGFELVGSDAGLPCMGCACIDKDGQASWKCSALPCHSWPHIPEQCHRVYKVDTCCPEGIRCDDTTILEGEFTCQVGNATYLEGHVFDAPDGSCRECVCQKDFNGTYNDTWCTRKPCSFELAGDATEKEGCAPVFYKDHCCLIEWHCPSVNDTLLPGNGTTPPTIISEVLSTTTVTEATPQCKFGDLYFNIFDRLATEQKTCSECVCLVPPYLTCFRKIGCRTICDPSSCITPNKDYYRELNCLPIHDNGECCPTRFDCNAVFENKTECHFGSELYHHKAELIGTEIGLPCEHCTCHLKKGRGGWSCAIPECFNWPQVSENCRPIHTQDACCPIGVVCENTQMLSNTSSVMEDEISCIFDGVKYGEGHVFQTQTTPCKKCICQKGYDGTLDGPWCEDLMCGFQLHNSRKIVSGCAPVYSESDSCCPIGWHRPHITDTVVRSDYSDDDTPVEQQCTFGHLRFNIYDSLSVREWASNVSCTCIMPPTLTCTQEGNN